MLTFPQRWIAIDTETTGLRLHGNKHKAFFVSYFDHKNLGGYYSARVTKTCTVCWDKQELDELSKFLRSYDSWVFHHAEFDLLALKKLGITPRPSCVIHDTLKLAHVAHSQSPSGLKELALLYLRISTEDEKALKQRVRSLIPKARKLGCPVASRTEANYWLPLALDQNDTSLSSYGCLDAHRTAGLFSGLKAELTSRENPLGKNFRKAYHRELSLIPVVQRLEAKGICINEKGLSLLRKEYGQAIASAEKKCKSALKLAGKYEINLKSGVQVGSILCDSDFGFGLTPAGKTATGRVSTSRASLTSMLSTATGHAKTLIKNLLILRSLEKSNDYLNEYERESYRLSNGHRIVRSSFWPNGTSTTRLSSSAPNLQNVGKNKELILEDELISITSPRQAFGPRPGCVWYSFDYDQLELRLMAFASQERRMLAAFAEGRDLHLETGIAFFGKPRNDEEKARIRRVGKGVNFSIGYGAGRAKIAALTGKSDGYEQWKRAYPSLDIYMRRLMATGERTGYVTTLWGYPLAIPENETYAALNYVIQGTAGDMLKNAMLAIASHGIFPILTIHDELVFEFEIPRTKKDKAQLHSILLLIKDQMMQAGKDLGATTPADCSCTTTFWNKLVPVDLTKGIGL